ncbi:DNA-dependent protein kinase catalytic subunit, partial [Clonorchis sinensis]
EVHVFQIFAHLLNLIVFMQASTNQTGDLNNHISKVLLFCFKRVVRTILNFARTLHVAQTEEFSLCSPTKPSLFRTGATKRTKLDESRSSDLTTSELKKRIRPKGWKDANIEECVWALLSCIGQIQNPQSSELATRWSDMCFLSLKKLICCLGELKRYQRRAPTSESSISISHLFFQTVLDRGNEEMLITRLEAGLCVSVDEGQFNDQTFQPQWMESLTRTLNSYSRILSTDLLNVRILQLLLLSAHSQLLKLLRRYVNWCRQQNLHIEVTQEFKTTHEQTSCTLAVCEFAVKMTPNSMPENSEYMFPPEHDTWWLLSRCLVRYVLHSDRREEYSVNCQRYLELLESLSPPHQQVIIRNFEALIIGGSQAPNLSSYVHERIRDVFFNTFPHASETYSAQRKIPLLSDQSVRVLCHLLQSVTCLLNSVSQNLSWRQQFNSAEFGVSFLGLVKQACSFFGSSPTEAVHQVLLEIIGLALASLDQTTIIEYLLDQLLLEKEGGSSQQYKLSSGLSDKTICQLLLWGRTELPEQKRSREPQFFVSKDSPYSGCFIDRVLSRMRLAIDTFNPAVLNRAVTLLTTCLDLCLLLEGSTKINIAVETSPKQQRNVSSIIVSRILDSWTQLFERLVCASPYQQWSNQVMLGFMERLLMLGSKGTDWSPLVPTVVFLLRDPGLSLGQKICVLDMLSIFLRPVRSASRVRESSTSETDTSILQALKEFLATQLPINQEEFKRDGSKSEEYRKVFTTLLSCLELTGSCVILEALLIPFCREDLHPMDVPLENALAATMKRHRHCVPTQLAFLDLCHEQLIPSTHGEESHQPVALDFFWRLNEKFFEPLLLYVSHTSLEIFAVNHVVDWLGVLRQLDISSDEADALHDLFVGTLCFNLFTVLYNRLPKVLVHDKDAKLVKTVIQADHGGQASVEYKGVELTRSLIKLAHDALDKLQSNPTPGLEASSSRLKKARRHFFSAAWSCLSAAVCSTQTQVKFYQNLLFRDGLFQQLLPDSFETPLYLPSQHPILHRGRFLNVPETLWSSDELPSQANTFQPVINDKTKGYGTSYGTPSGTFNSAFAGSTLAMELNRFDRIAGTQLLELEMYQNNVETDYTDTSEPVSSTAVVSDTPPTKTTGKCVQLPMDSVNREPLVSGMTGLLKHLDRLLLSTEDTTMDLTRGDPFWSGYLHRQMMMPSVPVSVQTCIVKIIVNCPEVFQPYGRTWLQVLLRFLTSNPTGVVMCNVPVRTFTTLFTDICLMLARWADPSYSSPTIPQTSTERDLATQLLSMLFEHLCGNHESHMDPATSQQITQSAEPRPGLPELFKLLVECWERTVQPPCRAVYDALCRTDVSTKQLIVTLDLTISMLRSKMSFDQRQTNFSLDKMAGSLIPLLDHENHSVRNSALLAAALLLHKGKTSTTSQVSLATGINAQSLPTLDSMEKNIYDRITCLGQSSTSSTFNAHQSWSLELACRAALSYIALQSHLIQVASVAFQLNQLSGSTLNAYLNLLKQFMADSTEVSSTMVATLTQCLFSTDKTHQDSTSRPQNFFEQLNLKSSDTVKLGLEVGKQWIRTLVSYSKSLPKQTIINSSTITPYRYQILSVLSSAVKCFSLNAPRDVREAFYQICVTVWEFRAELEPTVGMHLAKFGLLYGLTVETDLELASNIRRFVLDRCLPSNTIDRAMHILTDIGSLANLWDGLPESVWDWTQNLVLQLFPKLLHTINELTLEPATLTAEYQQVFFDRPLDPSISFQDLNLSNYGSVSLITSDPAIASLAPFATQTAFTTTTRADKTLAFTRIATQSKTLTAGTLTIEASQQMTQPVNKKARVEEPTYLNSVAFSSVSQAPQTPSESSTEVAPTPYELRIQRLRNQLNWRESTKASHTGDFINEHGKKERNIFRERAIARQRAELRLFQRPSPTHTLDPYLQGTLTAKYRTGPLPDVESISPASLLDPLQRLSAAQPSAAATIFVNLYSVLLQSVSPQTEIMDSILNRFAESLHDILRLTCRLATISTTDSALHDVTTACLVLLSKLVEIHSISAAATTPMPLPLDSSTVATSAVLSKSEPVAIVLLEEAFNLGLRQRIPNPRSNCVNAPSWSDPSELVYFPQPSQILMMQSSQASDQSLEASTVWWDLTRLYRSNGRFEEVLGWLLDRWSIDSQLFPLIGEALVTISELNYTNARLAFERILETPHLWTTCPDTLEPGLQAMCQEGLMACLERMASWDDLDALTSRGLKSLAVDASAGSQQLHNVSFSSVWSHLHNDSSVVETLLPLLFRARLKRLQDAMVQSQYEEAFGPSSLEAANMDLCDFVQSALEHDNVRSLFEVRFPEELSIFYCWKGDFVRALYFQERALKHHASDWRESKACDPFLSVGKSARAQTLTELNEFLNNMLNKDISFSKIKSLVNTWHQRPPHPSLDPLPAWNDIILNRLFYLTIMSTKCSPASGASSALVEQGEAVTPHFLDNTIFSLRMAEVNACITQNDPVLALNHLKNIRMLAQRGSAVESLGGYSHPRDGLWLRWCEAFADAWVVWADNAVTVNARLPTKSVESQSTLRQVYAIEDLVKGLANAGLHLVNCSTNRPHLLTDCSSGSHTDMVPFTFFTKLGRLLSRLSLLVDVPADDGQLSQQASDRLNLLLRELATPLFSSYGYDTSSSTLSACLSSYTLSLTSQATRMAMSLKFETSKMTPSLNQQLSEPMIVLADFCDRKLTEASPSIQQAMEMDSEQLSTGALCYSFIEATLCSMQLNHRAGHLRFPRALQLASTDNDPGSSIQSLFISGTAKLPTWMFTQWLDLLVTGLFATATSEPVLVNQIIDRVAVDYAQIMLPPFLVKTSALLDDYWSNTDELAGGPGFNLQSINDAARPSVQRLFQLLSESQVYARFVEELSFLEEPKLVLKDWLASRAKRTVSNSEPNSGARLVLVQDYTNLLLRSFRRSTTCELSPEGFIVETASGSLTSGPYRTMLSERLMKACNQVFGPGGSQFASASITDIEQSIKQLELLLETQQTPSDVNRLADYSPWLATFSSNDSAGGQFLAVPSAQYSSINHAQLTQRAHIYRFGLSLNTLVSLRQPKLISLVGSNAKHYSWLVKGGEDLRQDTRIQHMFSITNQLFGSNWFGAASFFNPQSENAPVLVRTYSIIPISNRVGLVEWLESATTLLAFYKAAMCDSELQNFNQEISFFGELLAGSDYSGLWCSPLTSYPKSLRPEQIVTRFRELENRIRSWRLLRRGLQRMSRDVTHFMELRSMCIRTQASLSAVHYVLGIGDRHPLNFLLCRKTGAFIGIDFGYAFGVTTLVLPVPELVPFRLTACQRELLEPSGPAGMFGYTLGRTLASARMARPLLTSLLQVFVKDSSCWALYSHLIQQSQIDFTRGRLELALKKLSGHSPATLLCEEVAIRYKSHAWFPEFCRLIDQLVLVGPQNVEANSQLALTPEEQARQLTRLATSADLLARAHIGWHSFL